MDTACFIVRKHLPCCVWELFSLEIVCILNCKYQTLIFIGHLPFFTRLSLGYKVDFLRLFSYCCLRKSPDFRHVAASALKHKYSTAF